MGSPVIISENQPRSNSGWHSTHESAKSKRKRQAGRRKDGPYRLRCQAKYAATAMTTQLMIPVMRVKPNTTELQLKPTLRNTENSGGTTNAQTVDTTAIAAVLVPR